MPRAKPPAAPAACHAPTPPPPKAPRARPPSELRKPVPGLTPEQAAALKALSGENCYGATVGAGCKVVRVVEADTIPVAALKGLVARGLVEVVTLIVYQRSEK